MRVVRVEQIDWTGKPYQVCDVVYAVPASGAAVVTDEGIVTGIGAGPGIDKFVEDLEALISDVGSLRRDLEAKEGERNFALTELEALRGEVDIRPAPAAGFTITELSDAIVKVVNAVKA